MQGKQWRRLLAWGILCWGGWMMASGRGGAFEGARAAFPPQDPAGPAWSWNQPIYEVSLEKQTEAGTFRAFESRLPDLRRLGVGIIWLMPIHPRSGNPPDKPHYDSPYCVRDYYDVDPRYGTKEDFRRLVRAVHEAGMYVIMDWVPNHTAWGNPLLQSHPEFYAKDAEGRIRQAGPWADVAQLDHSNREVWNYMRDARLYWIREFDVDGFREDVAGALPMEYWEWLAPQLQAAKPIFWLAESDDPKLHPVFHMTYDWTFQTVVWKVVHFEGKPDLFDEFLLAERRRYPPPALRMRHLTNHDMDGSGYAWGNRPFIDIPFLERTSLTEKYGPAHQAAAVLMTTLPFGRPMIWNGQELGLLERTPRKLPWKESPFFDFYRRLFSLYREHPALYRGDFRRVAADSPGVYAFVRQSEDDCAATVCNLSGETVRCLLAELPRDLPDDRRTFREVFTDEERSLADLTTQPLELAPWSYCVWAN